MMTCAAATTSPQALRADYQADAADAAGRGILGESLTRAPEVLPIITALLPADGSAFRPLRDQFIYRSIVKLGPAADLLNVRADLGPGIEAIGGATYLSELANEEIGRSKESLQYLCTVILAEARRRRLVAAAQQLEAAMQRGDAPDEALRQFEIRCHECPTPASDRPQPVDLEAIAATGIPPVPWIVPGWLTVDDVAILAGGPYVGKTTTVYDVAQRFVRCEPWLGMTPVRALRVLVIDEELGSRAASRLMLRLGGHHANLRLFSVAGFNLGGNESERRLYAEIADFRPDLVVFDSMTHLLAGVESENDSLQMADVFRRLYRLRDELRTAFLIVDHRGKWGRLGTPPPSELLDLILRGSTVKGTQASTVWAMIRADDASTNLIQLKRRESDRLLSIRIGYEATEDGPITLVNLGTPDDLMREGEKAQLWIVGYLEEHGTATRGAILAASTAANHGKRTIERALRDLKATRRLENPKWGQWRVSLGGNLAERGANEGGASELPF